MADDRSRRLATRRARLGPFMRRSRQVLVLAALTGGLTGLGVAGFEWLTRQVMFDRLTRQPIGVQIGAPVVGLLLAAAILRWVARTRSPSTADEYIKNFHQPGRRLDLRPVPGRLLASVATLGFGGALGYEGPSIYLGSAVGSLLHARLGRFFSREDAKVLVVAGAAAGVAAIFKAPATGLVFALEVPYREDFARRMLLPAGMAAAVSYIVFVAFTGTKPLIPVSGSPPFNLKDLGGAVLLGVVCGIGANLFTQVLTRAKRTAAAVHPFARAAAAGAGLAGLAALSYAVFGQALTLGPGYDNLTWAFDPRRDLVLVVALLAMRAAATVLTVGGGGVGGLFVPLVIEGALVGRVVGGLFRTAATGSNFFPLVGVSAFLGAGYRVPLAGVVFAAETSGRPGFIVPGLIAAMVAQLFMGDHSASTYQVVARSGHLERRFTLPVTAAFVTNPALVAPRATLVEFFRDYAIGRRQHAAVVVEGGRYLGVVRIEELAVVPQDEWPATTVAERMRTDFPIGQPTWSIRDALRTMEAADVDLLPVVRDGAFVGLATTTEILRLDDILRSTGTEDR